uniref:Ycf54 n=2 Tax=Gracilariopsis TaxID=2781 RepID=A0A1C9CEZ7_9FLOR|nr:hypothetical protein [Gracilariopsis lemaneiformis]YP_009294718.1 hypothetical protein Gch_119 [Gracilariopsis chorda]AJO68364.1 hypothetical protein [Gracilariopsis lemaneiformis]AML79960.1 hypothetical protein [Gracilariopsis lemaneiformis]AOM66978.1 hypothetical protein Gch_119 [Gracilariopsis chorda]UAD88760.1 hypothetical protein [Gracilariopsis chorda]
MNQNKYYFVIASKNFLMNEEPIEEILRERTSHYKNIQKDIDFWFITNPNFIKSLHINHINKESPENYAAIVSLDEKFIQWLKLRIGFVVIGQLQSDYLLYNIKYT